MLSLGRFCQSLGSGIFASELFFWNTLILWFLPGSTNQGDGDQQFHPKRWYTSTTLHGVTSQKTLVLFIPPELGVSLFYVLLAVHLDTSV